MALTGKFLADFSDFQAEVEKATTSLRFFQTSSDDAGKALTRATESFSGRKIIQEATLAVEAVNRLGGVSKLTANEQAQLNRLLTEADEKYRALGTTGDAEMQRLAAETKKAEQAITGAAVQTTNWKDSLTKAAGALGLALSVGAVVQFGRSVLAMGDDVQRTADRTGLMTDEVQKLSFIAGQSGNTLEDITGALGQMQNRLTSGDASAVGALKTLNLSFEDLARLDPYEQMQLIARGISQIPNPANQAQLAMDLFGRTGIAILPTLKSEFDKLGDAAPVMSQKTVQSLDEAGDALAAFQLRLKVLAGEGVTLFSHFGDGLVLGVYPALAKLDEGLASVYQSMLKIPGAAKLFPAMQGNIDDLRQSAQWFRDAVGAQVHQLDLLAGSVTKVTPPMERLSVVTKQAGEHHRAHAAAVRETRKAVDDAIPSLRIMTGSFSAMGETVKLDVPLVHEWNLAVRTGTEGMGQLGERIEVSIPSVRQINLGIGELAQALAQLAQISGDSLGGMVRGFSEVVSSIDIAGRAMKTLREAQKVFTDGSALAGILGMTTGIFGIASAAIQAAKAIAGLFDRNKGRDLVVDFAAQHGGFDQLHKDLGALGAEGERLWIKLTQGVGRNNPDQAREAIDEITKALEGQVGALADSANAATAVYGSLSHLNSFQFAPKHIKVYHDDEAGNAIPMASGGSFLVTRPTLFLAGEAGPERATFSGGGRTGSTGTETPTPIVLNIDGQEFLRTFVTLKKRYVG